MDKPTLKKLREEMTSVAEKYGLLNASVCFEDKDGNFGGIVLGFGEKVDLREFFAIAVNVGRWWQSVREMGQANLNLYEGKR